MSITMILKISETNIVQRNYLVSLDKYSNSHKYLNCSHEAWVGPVIQEPKNSDPLELEPGSPACQPIILPLDEGDYLVTKVLLYNILAAQFFFKQKQTDFRNYKLLKNGAVLNFWDWLYALMSSTSLEKLRLIILGNTKFCGLWFLYDTYRNNKFDN